MSQLGSRISLSQKNTTSNEWIESYFGKATRLISPPIDRLTTSAQNNEPIKVYQLTFNELRTSKIKSNSNQGLQIHASLFDTTYKQFYGRTCMAEFKSIQIEKGVATCKNEESMFLATSITHMHLLIVCELVTINDGKETSLGWSAFRPFGEDDGRSMHKLDVYAGTARALLFLDDPFEKNKNLTPISESLVICSFSERPKLASYIQFIPENVLIGRFDPIGAIRGRLDQKPEIVAHMSIIIDDLFVFLNPNVGRFESEFCRLVAEDKSIWDKLEIEPSMITITERRLKVGVHNGWKYVHEPFVIQLSVNEGDGTGAKRRLNLKASLKQKTSETEESALASTNHLTMRNSLVLNNIFEHPLCAVLFEIEYVINVPIHVNILNTINKKNIAQTKKQYETHHILVRWGAFTPFIDIKKQDIFDNEGEKMCEVSLLGSSRPSTVNPDFRLVYMTPNTEMHDKASSLSTPGKITFKLKKGNKINLKPVSTDEQRNNTSKTGYNDSRRSSQVSQQQQKPIVQSENSRFVETANRFQGTKNLYNQMMPFEDNSLRTSQANLLMNQLMNSQQMAETARSHQHQMLGLLTGNLELYPIYNPSLHMPVLALAPGQIGGRTMSRAAYAKLQSAKFLPILDRFDKPAEVIDGSVYTKFNLQQEEADMLTCNQIFIQFLAFSRTLESMRSGRSDAKPRRIFLTFQFYRFPEFRTPNLQLDQALEEYSLNDECTPFVLKSPEGGSGYVVCYSVDPTNLKYGEKKLFLQYLAHHAMFIDVWDAESLHLIGTATLQLKELLRQGKEAVQSTYELNVVTTEYDDDEQRLNSGHMFREGTPYTSDSHIKLKGMLHVRLGNVGTPYEDMNEPIGLKELITPSMPMTRVIASKSANDAFGQHKVTQRIDEATNDGFISHSFSKAHHMAETFKDIHAALVSEKNKSISDESDLDPKRRRRLARMDMVRKMASNADIPPMLIGNHRRVIEERNKDLKIMEFYRNQTKHDQILSKLREFTTTEYAIYPNFGIVEFFEFVITNPYHEAQVITIIIDDPDIQVVSDGREWRHLKILHQIYSQVEDNMFHRQEIDQTKANVKYPQIYLRPKETINIPFKFQTFKADNSVDASEAMSPLDNNKKDMLIRKVRPKYELRKSHIWFRAEDQNPIAILRLHIDQQPHVINQTFRFNECEHSFLKKTIRLPSTARALASETTALLSADIKLDGTSTEPGVSQLYVRTSDPDCVCESRPVALGEPHDVFVKIATGASPAVKKFYVAVYADQYLAIPLQIWQVFVHSLHRVDVTCTQGQISRFSLILKGTQSSRVVKCFASNPEEMSIVPQEKFMLAANAVQELNVGIQPTSSGVKHYYLNVVDTEVMNLVHSWFIYINCKPPVISKSFELTLPVSTSGSLALMPAQKRVSYTNPYKSEKHFILSTNRDDLLTFKERRIKFMANEQKTLALKFLPNSLAGFFEIYVFINNENNTNEETFALRVHYVQQQPAKNNY